MPTSTAPIVAPTSGISDITPITHGERRREGDAQDRQHDERQHAPSMNETVSAPLT